MTNIEYLQELLVFQSTELGQRIKLELQTIASEIVGRLDGYNTLNWLSEDVQKERAIYVAKLQQTVGITEMLFDESSTKDILENEIQAQKDKELEQLEEPKEISDILY